MSKQVQFIRRGVAILTVFVVTVSVQVALAHAGDWPHFRGPNRDGKSPETGLLKQWPKSGPRLIRTIRGFGHGYSSPVIVQGRIYVTGKVGDDLKIFCFDSSGNKIWETTHGRAYDGETAPHSPYPGARSTPTVHEDMFFLLGCLGKLAVYRISDGKQLWSMDLVADLGGRIPPWGYAESVLVDGDKVICTPGSQKAGTFAALDKRTGRLSWQSPQVTERAEYASPILIEFEGVRQVVNMTRGGLVAVCPETGTLLWRYNRIAGQPTPESATAHRNSPIYADGYVFESTGYQTRGASVVALQKKASGIKAELVWQTRKLNYELGGYVVVDGFVLYDSCQQSVLRGAEDWCRALVRQRTWQRLGDLRRWYALLSRRQWQTGSDRG